MRRSLWCAAWVMLGGCGRSFAVGVDFFDTAVFADGAAEDPAGGAPVWAPIRPRPNEVVDRTAAIEGFSQVDPVDLELQVTEPRGRSQEPVSTLSVEGPDGSWVSQAYGDLKPGREYFVSARDVGDDRQRSNVEFKFTTAAEDAGPETLPSGDWWIPGGDGVGMMASTLSRLVFAAGEAPGRALTLQIDAGRMEISLGALVRDPSFPPACEAVATAPITWTRPSFSASLPELRLGPPERQLVISGVSVGGRFDDRGDLVAFHLSGLVDLRASSEPWRDEVCAAVEGQGLACHSCEGKEAPACLRVDAREMRGSEWSTADATCVLR